MATSLVTEGLVPVGIVNQGVPVSAIGTHLNHGVILLLIQKVMMQLAKESQGILLCLMGLGVTL